MPCGSSLTCIACGGRRCTLREALSRAMPPGLGEGGMQGHLLCPPHQGMGAPMAVCWLVLHFSVISGMLQVLLWRMPLPHEQRICWSQS